MSSNGIGVERAHKIYEISMSQLKERLAGNSEVMDLILRIESSVFNLAQAIEGYLVEAHAEEQESLFDRIMAARATLHGADDRTKARLVQQEEVTQEFLDSLPKKGEK
jgi:hypothetical protein